MTSQGRNAEGSESQVAPGLLPDEERSGPSASPDPVMNAIQVLVDEIAKHDAHCWKQVGRCVYCDDCQQRLFQGRIPKTHTNVKSRQRDVTPKATRDMRARWGMD